MKTIDDIDLDYPIIQACGPKYAKLIENIYETFGCENFFGFGFGRPEYTGTVYFVNKKGEKKIVHVATDIKIDPELRKYIIPIKDFFRK